MADTPNFAKLVPGFDFLQGLVKNAGAALPAMGQWVAPTLNPEELEKRIGELRTVKFWLEQNARMLEATIQALEVQRMTLSTLKTMNVQMEDLRDSLQIRLPGTSAAAAPQAPAARGARAAEPAPAAPAPATKSGSASKTAGAAGPVDPMQWWGALTKQFTQLATQAMQDHSIDAGLDAVGSADPAAPAASAPPAATTASAHPAPARKAAAARKRAPARRRT